MRREKSLGGFYKHVSGMLNINLTLRGGGGLVRDFWLINPRRACAARVTVVVLCVCVCVCVHGSNLLVAQLRDKLVILTGSVLCSLQN